MSSQLSWPTLQDDMRNVRIVGEARTAANAQPNDRDAREVRA
jgi:hypothetical protein